MYLILGCGTAGYYVASVLKEQGKELTIVDISKDRIDSLRERDFENIIEGDMTDREVLKDANIKDAGAILILTTDLKLNKKTVKIARKMNPNAPIIVRAGIKSSKDEFREGEADIVIYPTEVVAESAIKSLEEIEFKKGFKRLKGIISQATKEIAIIIQDNPDPDAIASSVTLKRIIEHLGKRVEIIYGGEISHEENRALVNLMGIKLTHISKIKDWGAFSKIALVDVAVPGQNNSLPKNIRPDIVIDHHQVNKGNIKSEYVDIRPEVGATSTILTQYLLHANVEINEELGTLLLYGIKTDTQGFTRGATAADLNAVALLYAKANHELLAKIEAPLMSSETLDVLGEAIKNREIKGSFLMSNVGLISDRDTLPQAADYLLNLEGISTVLVYGVGKDVVHISGRTRDIRINLGDAMNMAFGDVGQAGGHATAAAAKIPLGLFGSVKDKQMLLKLAKEAVADRFLKVVGGVGKK